MIAHVTQVSLGATQPWKQAKAGAHVQALGKLVRRDIGLLRARGLQPTLVSWYSVMHGPISALRCDKPGWEKRVAIERALKGIFYEAREFVCYMEVSSGFVWRAERHGCSVVKTGNPKTVQALLQELEGFLLTPLKS